MHTLLQSPSHANPPTKSSSSFAHAHIPVGKPTDLPFPKFRALGPEFWHDPAFPLRRLDGLVEQEGLADVLYLRYRAFQVEGFRKHNLEYLRTVSAIHVLTRDDAYFLDVDAVARTAED